MCYLPPPLVPLPSSLILLMSISIRRIAARAVLALALTSVSATYARAQAPAAAATRITGVGGFAWGATAAQIRASKGEPMAAMPQAEGVQALVYEDMLLGEKVMLMLFVHPQQGLIRGGYISDSPTADRCEYTAQLFRSAIERRYPDLPQDERGMGRTDLAPCTAFAAQAGGYLIRWSEESTGSAIMLMLIPGQPGVMLIYSTRQGDEWERRKGANRL